MIDHPATQAAVRRDFDPKLRFRRRVGTVIFFTLMAAVMVGIVGLGILLVQVLIAGIPWLSWHFVSDFPSRHAEQAGLRSALFGTIWMMGLTALFAVPIGVGAAMYLEEYAPKNKLTSIIEINISNLAGVPSIVYGLLGLALFVRWDAFGHSILAGSLIMTLLVLPIVILASREAIRAVPGAHRLAAYAMGSTQWQVERLVVLPAALPGILTGVILALSRAVGEAAPMIAISALVFLTFSPTDPLDRFTVMPIQIFNWVSRPQDDFRGLAAAGIIVLLLILLTMNSFAIYLRNRYQTKSEE